QMTFLAIFAREQELWRRRNGQEVRRRPALDARGVDGPDAVGVHGVAVRLAARVELAGGEAVREDRLAVDLVRLRQGEVPVCERTQRGVPNTEPSAAKAQSL